MNVRWPQAPSLRALSLAAASVPYGASVRLRHALYDWGVWREHEAPMPVVSVGGLEAGGTGKTPMTALVLHRLLRAGLVPGLLTRGYRRRSRGLQVRAAGRPPSVHDLGDEAAMLVGMGLDVAVAACAHRGRGAESLAALGCNAAVMDDGLSHRQLSRALNIVMLRAEQPLASARLLPWGSLREPLGALRRADLVVIHHRESAWGRSGAPPDVTPFIQMMARVGCHAPVLASHMGPPDVRDSLGCPQQLRGMTVIGAAGTARPLEVLRALKGLGAQVGAFFAYPDHHPYGPNTTQCLARAAFAEGAQALVVTPKDAVKLPGVGLPPIFTLNRPMVLHDPKDLLGDALGLVFGGIQFAPPRNTLPHTPDNLL